MSHPTKPQGATLLEVLLVLAIASLIVVTVINQYRNWQRDLEAQELKANVDILFQGLSNYYRANCIQYKSDPNTISKKGDLDPNATVVQIFLPIDIQTKLKNQGFINKWPFRPNFFVNNSTPIITYATQFNRATAIRSVAMDQSNPPTQKEIGTIVLWKAQVAVRVNSINNAATYQRLLGADCVSSYDSRARGVLPCSMQSPGDYIVWERLPSFASPDTMTDLWPSMPTLNQFTQMYTTYPILNLTYDPNATANQYFLCGG